MMMERATERLIAFVCGQFFELTPGLWARDAVNLERVLALESHYSRASHGLVCPVYATMVVVELGQPVLQAGHGISFASRIEGRPLTRGAFDCHGGSSTGPGEDLLDGLIVQSDAAQGYPPTYRPGVVSPVDAVVAPGHIESHPSCAEDAARINYLVDDVPFTQG